MSYENYPGPMHGDSVPVPNGLPDRDVVRWKRDNQRRIHAREMAEMREQNERRMGNLTTQHYMHSHGKLADESRYWDEVRRSKAS